MAEQEAQGQTVSVPPAGGQNIRISLEQAGAVPAPTQEAVAKSVDSEQQVMYRAAEAMSPGFQNMLYKAISANRHTRPAYVEHRYSEAVRRYHYLQTGILDDGTPHLDAYTERRLAYRNLIVAGIIQTKLNQVAEHFRRPMGDKDIGARIRMKDASASLTPGAVARIKELENILFRGGMITEHPDTGEPAVWDGHYEQKADPLSVAIRKLTLDTLILDRIFVSIEGSVKLGSRRRNPVMYWKAEDAALIRMTSRDYRPRIRQELYNQERGTSAVSYVMLSPDLEWQILREYAWDEGAIAFRNPRTDFASFGYGRSEVEMCLDALVGILYGMNANKEYFDSNHIPPGILAITGAFGEDQLRLLRQQFHQEIGMPGSFWEFPIIQLNPVPGAGTQGVNWLQVQDRAHQDVIFEKYIKLCIAIVCAIFQIQPEEIGFSGFGRNEGALNNPDPESIVVQSQSKGLLPLVLFLCDFLSRTIVEAIDPDFELTIQGLSARYNPEIQALEQTNLLRQQRGLSMNQIAALNDEPPIYDPLDLTLWRKIDKAVRDEEAKGKRAFANEATRRAAVATMYEEQGGKLGSYPDAPAHPVLYQIWMAEHQAEQQEAQQAMAQMAGASVDQKMQEEGAERQEARSQMGALQGADDQREAERQQVKDGGPAMPGTQPEAGQPFGVGGGSAAGGKPFGKSLEIQTIRPPKHKVVVIGPKG